MAFLGRFFQLFVSLIFSFFVLFSARHEKMAAMSVRQVAPCMVKERSCWGMDLLESDLHGNLRVPPEMPTYTQETRPYLRDHEGMTLGGTATLRFPYLSSHPGCNRHRQDDIATGCS